MRPKLLIFAKREVVKASNNYKLPAKIRGGISRTSNLRTITQ